VCSSDLSASPRAYRRFARASPRRRAAVLRRATGGTPAISPYMPAPLDHPRNAGAISVLSSVGLSGVRGVEDEARRDALVALLRGQTFITVRDRGSSRLLDALGIEHELAPDAVHALGVLWPYERDPGADVAVVQISSAILRRLGHAEVGARLAASPQLRGRPVRLLLAGTATGHDSVADYEALIRHAPGVDLAVLDGRRPLDIVDQIRRARVVIGTSLHVRIIAAAYGVPRISLSRWKPTQYARAWDPDMPYDVRLGALDAADRSATSGRRAAASAATIAASNPPSPTSYGMSGSHARAYWVGFQRDKEIRGTPYAAAMMRTWSDVPMTTRAVRIWSTTSSGRRPSSTAMSRPGALRISAS